MMGWRLFCGGSGLIDLRTRYRDHGTSKQPERNTQASHGANYATSWRAATNPRHPAAKPPDRVTATFSRAGPVKPSANSNSVSWLKLEYVVKPPRNPAVTAALNSGLHEVDDASCAANPIAKQPSRLTSNVP